MTKQAFVRSFMERTGCLREDALRIVNAVFEHMHDTLLSGDEVRIDNVGKIMLKFRKPGVRQNNLTGEEAEVGPRVKLKLKTFPAMQRELNAKLAKV